MPRRQSLKRAWGLAPGSAYGPKVRAKPEPWAQPSVKISKWTARHSRASYRAAKPERERAMILKRPAPVTFISVVPAWRHGFRVRGEHGPAGRVIHSPPVTIACSKHVVRQAMFHFAGEIR